MRGITEGEIQTVSPAFLHNVDCEKGCPRRHKLFCSTQPSPHARRQPYGDRGSERSPFEFQPRLAATGYGSVQRAEPSLSDAGALFLGEIEAGSGSDGQNGSLLRRSSRSGEDRTHGRSPAPSNVCLLWRWGSEDLNDHDQLWGLIRCWRCSWCCLIRQARIGADPRDRGKPLAGKSTLNRLELTPVGADVGHRYKKIVARHRDLENWFVDAFAVADLEPASGDRFGSGRNRRSAARPSVGSLLSWLLQELLLPAAVHLLRRASAVRQVATFRHRCGRRFGEQMLARGWSSGSRSVVSVRIIVRGDSGFCRETLMCWCEDNGVDYVLGLAKNQRLTRILGKELYESQCVFESTGKLARCFKGLQLPQRKS